MIMDKHSSITDKTKETVVSIYHYIASPSRQPFRTTKLRSFVSLWCYISTQASRRCLL